MKFLLHLIRGDHLFSVEFASLQQFEADWPILEKRGFKPYYRALRENVTTRVVDDIFEKMDALDVQVTKPSCPKHGTARIWEDRQNPGCHYCGVKDNKGQWCGAKWDNNGRMLKAPK